MKTDPPYQRHSDTSHAAAEAIRRDRATLRQVVLSAIRNSPDGLTDEEIQEQTDMNPSTERPRRIELCAMNPPLVKDSGRKRPTKSGRAAVVWMYVPPGTPGLQSKLF